MFGWEQKILWQAQALEFKDVTVLQVISKKCFCYLIVSLLLMFPVIFVNDLRRGGCNCAITESELITIKFLFEMWN